MIRDRVIQGEQMVYYRESDLEQELKEMEKCLSEYLRDPGFGGALSEILCDMEKSRGKRLRPRLLLLADASAGKRAHSSCPVHPDLLQALGKLCPHPGGHRDADQLSME